MSKEKEIKYLTFVNDLLFCLATADKVVVVGEKILFTDVQNRKSYLVKITKITKHPPFSDMVDVELIRELE